jgi:hypothetical protein
MTVRQVLEAAHWPLGSGARTTCPLTQGDNPQAFSYTAREWYCFSCNEGGTPEKLAQRLLNVAAGIEGLGVPITPRQPAATGSTSRRTRWTGILDRLAYAACDNEWREVMQDAETARTMLRVWGSKPSGGLAYEVVIERMDALAMAHQVNEYALERGARLDAEMSRFRDLTRGARQA